MAVPYSRIEASARVAPVRQAGRRALGEVGQEAEPDDQRDEQHEVCGFNPKSGLRKL